MRHALPYCKTAKLGVYIGHLNLRLFAGGFDIAYNFINHELVIVFKPKGMFDRESSTNIDRIKLRTYFFQLAIKVDDLIQFTPVIDIILNTFVQKNVEHLQLELAFITF